MAQVRAVDTHTLAVGQNTHIVPVDLFGFGLGLGFGFDPALVVSVEL